MNLSLLSIPLMLASCGGSSSAVNANTLTGDQKMTDFNVNSVAALTKAIGAAKSGDRILLAQGNYGAVSIKNKLFTSDVTIMSTDAKKPAKIDSLVINGSSHLSFKGVEIGRPLGASEANFGKFGDMKNVSYITFDAVYVHGSLDGNAGNDGNGLAVTNGNHITIKNSRFEQLGRGVMLGSVTDVLLQGNSFSNMRSDGADFADAQRVTIDSNLFRDFYPVGADHPDAIQFWTTGTTRASSDITITNNQILQGKGSGLQGIFLRDQLGTLPYQNVKISNNLVYVPESYNGITVLGGKNVNVTSNSVLSIANDAIKLRIMLENVTTGSVKNNIADVFIDSKNTGVVQSNNRFLETDKSFASKIRDLNAGAAAVVSRLTVAGIGYTAVPSGSNAIPTATSTAATGTQLSASTGGFAIESFLPAGLADSPMISETSSSAVESTIAVTTTSAASAFTVSTEFFAAPAVMTPAPAATTPAAPSFASPSIVASKAISSVSMASAMASSRNQILFAL